MKQNAKRLLCLIAASMLFAGVWTCGSAFAAGKGDSCSLLTKEEVSEIVGSHVKEVKAVAMPRPNCQYVLEKGSVVVFLFPDAKIDFESGKKYQDKTQPVSGVGDDAYWSPNVRVINVLRKNTYFTVQFLGFKSGSLDTAKALALKAVTRVR